VSPREQLAQELERAAREMAPLRLDQARRCIAGAFAVRTYPSRLLVVLSDVYAGAAARLEARADPEDCSRIALYGDLADALTKAAAAPLDADEAERIAATEQLLGLASAGDGATEVLADEQTAAPRRRA